MSVTIKSARVERLVREVARMTEESLTEAIGCAMEERLKRLHGRKAVVDRSEALMAISRRCAALPDLDPRPEEEILGYGEDGAPHDR
jgi:hypothetical protein